MSYTILLYGATGYSGRLIAAEAARASMTDTEGEYRFVLAGRDGTEVARIAREHRMEARVFGIENRETVIRELSDVDVVINAAGPFALTANHLARGALGAECHYVDINGEADVYMRLDDLERHALDRNVALVVSAGHTAAASDLLLDVALGEIRPPGNEDLLPLGAIRIAVSKILTLSRGSLETLSRSIREQVRLVRLGKVEGLDGQSRQGHVLWHEPVGKLERAFDFFDPDERNGRPAAAKMKRDLRIASAANLVDTLTARLTVERHRFEVRRIESYVEAGTVARLAYQLAPALTSVAALPFVRDLARIPFTALPSGPTQQERDVETNFIVLEIENRVQERLIHWGWHTPNPYDFTAQVVVEIARRVARDAPSGWITPAAVLNVTKADLSGHGGCLRNCLLNER